ncbi:hypothetical protein D3C73_1635480 [compost metagenome]
MRRPSPRKEAVIRTHLPAMDKLRQTADIRKAIPATMAMVKSITAKANIAMINMAGKGNMATINMAGQKRKRICWMY